ncbi:hypothetical protein CB0940_08572 [Cercospora beticola]|uniref:Rhodopsin domain-containing protein n=1 Tax=Cercospora beticola TaxID=122368 RepID=A0A2G5HPR5_CERBT|nr:hypothetical protein CB0940_08572 [Cercospora beticola]PIA94547.1 hypothetical protein CB0940_08572 [Cercospora beticola]WPB05149.1 hypothetical protein RHO25_009799 [Cercospora beticola]CAK1364935.1 unnamed protein product [Cercospora beticola]
MLHGWASPTAVVATCIIMPFLAGVAVILRIYARFFCTKNAGWDDYSTMVSMLFSIATTVTIIAQVETGLGKHVKELSPHEAFLQKRAFFVMIIVYNISLCFTKLAILMQYKRLFPQKGFKLAVHISMAIVIIYAVWRFFAAIFVCSPVAAFWDRSIKPFHCQNKFANSMASCALNMSTDILIAALPLAILHKLQLPPRQRYALMSVFALAGFVVIISILRVPSIVTLWKTTDITYVNPMVMVWSDIEINIGLICACLPTLRCLFPKIFRSMTSGRSTDGSNKLGTGGSGAAATFESRNGGGDGSVTFNSGSRKDRRSRRASGMHANGGMGSFGGKYSVRSDEKKHVVLENVEEIEMASTKGMLIGEDGEQGSGSRPSSPQHHVHHHQQHQHQHQQPRRQNPNEILVQREIQQVESFRPVAGNGRAMRSARDVERMEREMV